VGSPRLLERQGNWLPPGAPLAVSARRRSAVTAGSFEVVGAPGFKTPALGVSRPSPTLTRSAEWGPAAVRVFERSSSSVARTRELKFLRGRPVLRSASSGC
jgi:hypothetical protein